jgi:putative peptidoglycan lipid II flippase
VTDPSSRSSSGGPPPSGDRAASRVGAGILLSRLAGFARDAVLAGYLGSSRAADIWYLGLRTPNIIQNLLGEGTLSASFIPIYARLVEEGREEEAGRFAGAVLGLVAAAAFGIALLGMLLAPVLVPVVFFALEPDYQRLLIQVIRILLPMTAILAVSAWALGILNTHRLFFVSYVAPVAWNLAIIAAAVAGGTWWGLGASGREGELVVVIAWGALVGGGLQTLVMLPWLRRFLAHVRPSLSTRVVGVRDAIRAFLPVVAARGAVNLSALVDQFLAALLGVGAVATLGRAQTLYLLPISLFGMAVAASALPELSRSGPGGVTQVAEGVRQTLRRVFSLLVPSAVAYLTFGDLLVEALLQRGAFGPVDTRVVTVVLGAYTLGLVASGSSRTLTSAFYALRNTATPARLAVLRVVVSIAVGALLMIPLDRVVVGHLRLGAAGLALGSAVGAWVEYILLRRALGRLAGPHGVGGGYMGRIGAAAAIGAGGALVLRLGVESPVRAGLPPELAGPLLAIGTASVFGVLYLVTAQRLDVGLPLRRILGR